MLTGESSPSSVGAITAMDGENQIWLTNQLYTPKNSTWTPVKWTNEANGRYPQYFGVPGFASAFNLGFRMDQQCTQNMVN